MIFRNSARSLMYKCCLNGVALLTSILFVRLLSVEDFGRYAYVMSLAGITGVVASLGLDQYFIREMSGDPNGAQRMLAKYLGLQVVLSSLVSAAFASLAIWHRDPAVRHGILWLSLGLFASFLFNPMTAIQFARGRNDRVSLEMLLQTIFQALLTVIGWRMHAPLEYYFAIPLATALVRSGHTLFVNGRRGDLAKPSVQVAEMGSVIAAGIPFVLLAGINTLYAKIDILLFSTFQGERITGLYSVAGKLAYVLAFIPYTLCEGLFPVFSRRKHADENEHRGLLADFIFYGLLVTLPIAVGGAIESRNLILALFGARYIEVFVPMSIYLFVPVCVSLYAAAGYRIAALRRMKTLLGISVVALVLNSALNLVAVKTLQGQRVMVAGALITLGTEILVTIASLVVCARAGALGFPVRRALKLALPLTALGATLYAPLASLTGRIVLAALAYALALWFGGALGAEEKSKIIASVFPSRARRDKILTPSEF